MRQGVVFGVRLPSCSMVVDREESLLDKSVQLVEIDVGKQRTENRALRRSAQRCIPSPLFQVPCLEQVLDETNEAFVIYVPTKYVNQHFVVEEARRGKLIMPCGSGKSLAAYWIAADLKARCIVIAVPSLALIRQTLKVWLRESVANHESVDWICVCSDESAGRIERDDAAVLRQDLGVPCLTDADEIAAWLKKNHHGLTVVFTTYQSGDSLSRAARTAKLRVDLGIMDEAHKRWELLTSCSLIC